MATCANGRWTLDPRKVVEGEATTWGELWAPEGREPWVERPPLGEPQPPLDGATLWEIARRARQVAATSTPVLILGETGTGQERLARALHTWSPRAAALAPRGDQI